MRYFINFSIVCVLCLVIVSQPFPITDEVRAALYLQKCGYLVDGADSRSHTFLAKVPVSNALKGFQRVAGLKQTGLLDDATMTMMKKLPCDDKDRIGHSNTKRMKIYALLGIDVLQIDTLEFEPFLDLAHIDEKNAAITFPYKVHALSFQEHINDIKADEALRDSTERPAHAPEREPPRPSTTVSPYPNLCLDGSIDAATLTENGHNYFFKGDFYWRILDDRVAYGYPRKIKTDFQGLEGNLDAAFTWSSGSTFFFKGKWYWKSKNQEMESDYPRLIAEGFVGIPDYLDAAFVSGNDGHTYFFKGDKYWRYDSNSDPPISSNYSRPISDWAGLPNDIDAAFQYENRKSYFFKGGSYYRIYDNEFKVDIEHPPYPRSTSKWWFHC